MSVVVRTPEGNDRIISKGAPEAIFDKCVNFRLDGKLLPMDHPHIEELKKEYELLSADGFRVLALATKDAPPREGVAAHATPYGKADECDLTLEGYVAFLDPPKESALAAIKALERHGVRVKVITGDNELVARKVCKQVGLVIDRVLLGDAVEKLTDAELAEAAEETVLFARVSPAHKQRIIRALQSRNHTVGFMGDGINDAPALHAADVGISVDTAVDIAKESADIILLEKSLLVLDEGVLEGRKVFSNIVKYVRMGASSNFGNMFSVLGASVFVPFLPMRPIQILANNLLYDVGQAAIPTDAVDAERIQAAADVGPQGADALHPLHRTVLVDLRLLDVLPDALRLQLLERLDARGRRAQPEPLSDGLVRGEPAHADPHHPRHPHEQDPVPPEQAVHVPAGHERGDHGDRRGAAVHSARPLPRLHRAAGALLAVHRDDAPLLRAAHAGGQGVAPAPPLDLSQRL